MLPQEGGEGQSSNWGLHEPSKHKNGLSPLQVTTVLHSSKLLAHVPSGQLTLFFPHDSYSGHSSIVALHELSKHFMTTYDEASNIGKRYRREDAIGTPFCVTIDDETLNNNTVTVRDRDTMEQVTIKIDELVNYINERIKF